MHLKTILSTAIIGMLLGGCTLMKPHYSEEQMHAYLFKKFDGNGDGVITKAEYTEFIDKRFGKMDQNGDGTITGEELYSSRFYTYLPELAEAVFRDSDTDSNGTVIRDEMVAAEKIRFAAMDSSGDGRLTEAEFTVNDMSALEEAE